MPSVVGIVLVEHNIASEYSRYIRWHPNLQDLNAAVHVHVATQDLNVRNSQQYFQCMVPTSKAYDPIFCDTPYDPKLTCGVDQGTECDIHQPDFSWW